MVFAGGERAGQDDERIDGTHFRIDGDRQRPGGGDGHERGASGARAGEADGLGGGVPDDGLADGAAAAVKQREDALGHVGFLGGVDHGVGDDFGDAGVALVGDDDDRTSGGKRGGGVSAGHGVGEREIPGAEHGDGAERAKHRAEIGLGQGLAVRDGVLDARVHPGAFFDEIGEHPELAGGAGGLTAHAGLRQAGFLRTAGGDVIHDGLDARGDGAEESGAFFSG